MFTRITNHLTDGNGFLDFLHRRWLAGELPDSRYVAEGIQGMSIVLPADTTQHRKAEDPNWRRNWQWIVLKVVTNTPVRIYCYRGIKDPNGRYTLLRVSTERLAMRVGFQSVHVFATDKSGDVVPISRVATGLPLNESLATERSLRDQYGPDELTFI